MERLDTGLIAVIRQAARQLKGVLVQRELESHFILRHNASKQLAAADARDVSREVDRCGGD